MAVRSWFGNGGPGGHPAGKGGIPCRPCCGHDAPGRPQLSRPRHQHARVLGPPAGRGDGRRGGRPHPPLPARRDPHAPPRGLRVVHAGHRRGPRVPGRALPDGPAVPAGPPPVGPLRTRPGPRLAGRRPAARGDRGPRGVRRRDPGDGAGARAAGADGRHRLSDGPPPGPPQAAGPRADPRGHPPDRPAGRLPGEYCVYLAYDRNDIERTRPTLSRPPCTRPRRPCPGRWRRHGT